ncbi:peptidoglycan DD-metalloendopeptidase family protein [Alphaproteobacteria bacterium]|nr:peptidoglycan DD-metalloendopeptidase family protein [Alphaproteobacteria bacterium]
MNKPNKNTMQLALATSLIPVMSLTLLSGCKVPNMSLSRTEPAPVVTAPLRVQTETIPASGIVTVRQNDTLYIIATRYRVTPQSIILDNNLIAPFTLLSGQQLQLKPTRFHIVQPGDSLLSISQRFAVGQFQLAELNNLKEPYSVAVGDRLQLPFSQDFSVLETGLPQGIASTGSTQTASDSPSTSTVQATTASVPRKKFVAPTGGGTFIWPVQGEVIAEFGPAARGVRNDGVNIAAAQGDIVSSTSKGRVAFVGTDVKSFGTLVLVKHDGGMISAYAHLDSVTVKEGDIVDAGQAIGTVGQTGRVDSPQLHFEIRKARQPIDPRLVIT